MSEAPAPVVDQQLLALLAAEILDWRNTGTLNQTGWLTEYAQHFSAHGEMSVRMAEDAVVRLALEYVVARADTSRPTT